MDIFMIFLWIITGVGLVISMFKDKEKTLTSMKMAANMMKRMIGQIIGILFLIGLILTFIPPEGVTDILSKTNILFATMISAFVGSITLIPAFVAFPLVSSFVDIGMSIVPAVAFLTTLTMVGLVTFSLEKQEFGLKFALTRNILSFLFAIFISLIMGVIL
ncbi:permease [Clostridium formicaceticum]|uniref:Permease n=1 Tax=Clostridium formicaceticum TaxID=1497 RepID=A0AAC9WHU3_9CLOT|nr:permease [Clostridium formicaceticum]AOY74919.1 permease [Clostridium formicaceticum]ARE89326.1 putative permease [Clostridium formicaceticum]